MKFRVNHFEEKDGQRTLTGSYFYRAKTALKAIAQHLFPEARVEGYAGTKHYGEYRNGNTLVRATVCR